MINLAKGEDDKVGEIDIYGVIGGSWDGTGVTPSQFKKDLAQLGDLERLNVHIHSYGGFVYEGWAIFNALDTHKAEVHIYVDGVAMSMASVILMAADVKHIAKNGTIMIHNPLTIGIGESKDFRKIADDLDKIRDQIVDAYIAGGVTSSREEIIAMMDEETYLTADEALEIGFVDFIGEEIEAEASASAAAQIMAHLSTLTGMPANVMETVKMTQTSTSPAAPAVTEDQIKAAADAATAAAAQRFRDIMALSKPGVEALAQQLALDPTVTVADAKTQIADKYLELSENKFSASSASRNDPVTQERIDPAPANTDQERWDKNEGGVQDQFLNFEGFVAFNKANEAGLVKILTNKK